MTLRLIEPSGYTVQVIDVPAGRDPEQVKQHLLTVVAVKHAAQWADFGYRASHYRVLTDPAA